MKTIRRDKLMRDVEKGLYLASCCFDFNPMTDGPEMGDGKWRPARIRKPLFEKYINEHGYERERCTNTDHKDGWFNLDEHDFKSHSGRAYRGQNGVVTLHVHSNCVYEFKPNNQTGQL